MDTPLQITIVNNINEKINELITLKDPQWVSQRSELIQLLDYNTELIKNYNLANPDNKTLEKIEQIKQHMNNLNTSKNAEYELYGGSDGIMLEMYRLKIHVMGLVENQNYYAKNK